MLELIFYYTGFGILYFLMILIGVVIAYKALYVFIPWMFGEIDAYNIAESYNYLIGLKKNLGESNRRCQQDILDVIMRHMEIALNRPFKVGDPVLAFQSDENGPVSGALCEVVTVEKFSHTGRKANDNNKNYFFSGGKEYLFYDHVKKEPVVSVSGNDGALEITNG